MRHTNIFYLHFLSTLCSPGQRAFLVVGRLGVSVVLTFLFHCVEFSLCVFFCHHLIPCPSVAALGVPGSRINTTHFHNWDLVHIGAHSFVQDNVYFTNVRQSGQHLILEECRVARPQGAAGGEQLLIGSCISESN